MSKEKDKIEDKPKKQFDSRNGVTLTWDGKGNCFVAMPVNTIPKKQFEEWIKECRINYSGKRWDMILADHIKAKAYEVMLSLAPASQDELPEEKESNPDGLMNGGTG